MLFACAVIAAYISANRSAMPGLEKNGADRGLILLAGWLGLVLAGGRRDRQARSGCGACSAGSSWAPRRWPRLGAVEFFTGLDLAKYIWVPGLTAHTQVTDLIGRAGLLRVTATARNRSSSARSWR